MLTRNSNFSIKTWRDLVKGKDLSSSIGILRLNLDVAKVSEVADPRRPGRSRINILRVLDNKGDATSQTFPKGKN